jgi:hypothetical protein
MAKGKGRAQGPLHDKLVEHLLRTMEQEGLTIEAANAPGHRKPGHVKGGPRRTRVRPDVVARDGRRAIFGIANSDTEASLADVHDQLETLAGKCRMLVICIPEQTADHAVDALFQSADMSLRQKMRLLRHPDARWQAVPRRQPATRHPGFAVRVVVERDSM